MGYKFYLNKALNKRCTLGQVGQPVGAGWGPAAPPVVTRPQRPGYGPAATGLSPCSGSFLQLKQEKPKQTNAAGRGAAAGRGVPRCGGNILSRSPRGSLCREVAGRQHPQLPTPPPRGFQSPLRGRDPRGTSAKGARAPGRPRSFAHLPRRPSSCSSPGLSRPLAARPQRPSTRTSRTSARPVAHPSGRTTLSKPEDEKGHGQSQKRMKKRR